MNNYNEDMMDMFWQFVVERQTIYHKRMVEEQLPPWTEDSVLQNYFFTNVYRELDKGTVFLIRNILKIKNDNDLLFAIMVYRLFNDIDTFRFLMLRCKMTRYGTWDWQKASRYLNAYENHGNRVFTDAFTVTGVKFGGFPDKIRNICWLIGKLQQQVPRMVAAIKSAKSLHRIWQIFNDTQGFGRFLAYELAIDVNYSRLSNFSENDWVNAGPGCKRGIQWIWGARDPSVKWEDYIAFLQVGQETYIARIDRLDEWYQVWPGYAMTLRGVEHSLCEFQKYARARYHRNPDGTPSRSATRKYINRLQPVLL
jgi:alpha-glutamyl/putrescinyl thymine pyrophosphorylase clade 1